VGEKGIAQQRSRCLFSAVKRSFFNEHDDLLQAQAQPAHAILAESENTSQYF